MDVFGKWQISRCRAGSVRLKDGDKIKWLYTHDWEDIGAPSYKRDSSNAELKQDYK